jgi:hypothetical protein
MRRCAMCETCINKRAQNMKEVVTPPLVHRPHFRLMSSSSVSQSWEDDNNALACLTPSCSVHGSNEDAGSGWGDSDDASNLQCPTGPCALRADCAESVRSPRALRRDYVESVCTVWSLYALCGVHAESEPVRADSAQKVHSAGIEPGFQ